MGSPAPSCLSSMGAGRSSGSSSLAWKRSFGVRVTSEITIIISQGTVRSGPNYKIPNYKLFLQSYNSTGILGGGPPDGKEGRNAHSSLGGPHRAPSAREAARMTPAGGLRLPAPPRFETNFRFLRRYFLMFFGGFGAHNGSVSLIYWDRPVFQSSFIGMKRSVPPHSFLE